MENFCAKKQLSSTTQGIDKLSFQVKEFKRNTEGIFEATAYPLF